MMCVLLESGYSHGTGERQFSSSFAEVASESNVIRSVLPSSQEAVSKEMEGGIANSQPRKQELPNEEMSKLHIKVSTIWPDCLLKHQAMADGNKGRWEKLECKNCFCFVYMSTGIGTKGNLI